MIDKRVSKPGQASGDSNDKVDDVIDNDLDSQVTEGNQQAARGWHTEEKPLSKRAFRRPRVVRPH